MLSIDRAIPSCAAVPDGWTTCNRVWYEGQRGDKESLGEGLQTLRRSTGYITECS